MIRVGGLKGWQDSKPGVERSGAPGMQKGDQALKERQTPCAWYPFPTNARCSLLSRWHWIPGPPVTLQPAPWFLAPLGIKYLYFPGNGTTINPFTARDN